MNFKKWMKISEERASVRQKPSGGTAMNQGFLRGSATTWGHTDTPDPLEKGVTAVASGIGSSYRNSLENDAGLVVQGVGRILNPPGMEEQPDAKYNFLPLQIPRYKHNNSFASLRFNLDSDKAYKNVSETVDANMIRAVTGPSGMENGIDMDGKFSLLSRDEETNNWNWDVSQAKQFTRALIYKIIVSADDFDHEKYDKNDFEVLGEEESEGVLLVWFGFKPKKAPQKVDKIEKNKGVNP